MATRLNIARLLLILGLAIGLLSWRETVGHIGDPDYVLPLSFPEGITHAWYHALREAWSDAAKMLVFLVVFFGPAYLRTREIWWLTLILMIGYYASFWIGTPFLSELAAPSAIAEAIHVAMAGFSVLALLVARPAFALRQSTLSGTDRP